MGAIVYTTRGGSRFHEDGECPALSAGLALSGGRYSPQGVRYRTRGMWAEDAARAGYTACRVCMLPALELPATGETFGHEPVTGVDWFGRGEIVCARCTEPPPPWARRARRARCTVLAHWPCTSAVVLGLVVTDADRWNQRYPIGTPVAAYPGTRTDEPLRTTTRTPAWRLGHGDSVVSVDGYAGGICLTHVDPL